MKKIKAILLNQENEKEPKQEKEWILEKDK
jgi:hypothetical protein